VCIGFTLRLIPAQLEYCIALGSYLTKIAHLNRKPRTAGRPGLSWLVVGTSKMDSVPQRDCERQYCRWIYAKPADEGGLVTVAARATWGVSKKGATLAAP
jgi:hypothetical protein